MNKIIKVIVSVCCVVGLNLHAQDQDASLFFMPNIPQSNHLNPALSPNYNWYIGLPGLSNIYSRYSNDITPEDVFHQSASGDSVFTPLSSQTLYKAFKNNLPGISKLSVQTGINLIDIGLQHNKHFYSFSYGYKIVSETGLPYSLFNIPELGEGKSVNIQDITISATAYSEMAFGYGYHINKYLSVGGKLKLLSGKMYAGVKAETANVKSNINALTATVDGQLRFSGPYYMTGDNVNGGLSFHDGTFSPAMLFDFRNPGIALDFGMAYKCESRWGFFASVTDLGSIFWSKDVNSVALKGSATFEGFDDALFFDDKPGTYAKNVGDSLLHQFKSKNTTGAFSSGLMPNVYLGTSYKLLPNLDAGALWHSQFSSNKLRNWFNMSLNYNSNHFFNGNIHYKAGINAPSALGGVLAVRLWPVQLYVAADAVSTKYNTYTNGSSRFNLPTNFDQLSVQVGLNLIFGNPGSVAHNACGSATKKTNSRFQQYLGSCNFSKPSVKRNKSQKRMR